MAQSSLPYGVSPYANAVLVEFKHKKQHIMETLATLLWGWELQIFDDEDYEALKAHHIDELRKLKDETTRIHKSKNFHSFPQAILV